jgi:hypothetical protein
MKFVGWLSKGLHCERSAHREQGFTVNSGSTGQAFLNITSVAHMGGSTECFRTWNRCITIVCLQIEVMVDSPRTDQNPSPYSRVGNGTPCRGCNPRRGGGRPGGGPIDETFTSGGSSSTLNGNDWLSACFADGGRIVNAPS